MLESDVVIKTHSQNYLGTGLTVDSVIRLHKIVTIPKDLIRRKLGVINNVLEVEIKRKIGLLFD